MHLIIQSMNAPANRIEISRATHDLSMTFANDGIINSQCIRNSLSFIHIGTYNAKNISLNKNIKVRKIRMRILTSNSFQFSRLKFAFLEVIDIRRRLA